MSPAVGSAGNRTKREFNRILVAHYREMSKVTEWKATAKRLLKKRKIGGRQLGEVFLLRSPNQRLKEEPQRGLEPAVH